MTLARAVAQTVDRIATPVEAMHRTISSGWFRAIGPVARPVQRVHDLVLDTVYGAIRPAARAIAWSVDRSPLRTSETADVSAQAWVNGLWGDTIEDGLVIDMTSMDVAGAPVAVGAPDDGPPDDRPRRLAILVHGLVETERRWRGPTGDGGLVRALQDAGLSPVLVRYNTGRPVAANGADLAEIVERVVAAWPAPVETVVLVGHSMGGLVARHACLAGAREGHPWIERLTDLVTIGTPHDGAPLERLARAAAWGLGVSVVTRPLGAFLDGRSRGIKDLGGRPSDDEVPPTPAHVRHRLVGGAVTRDPSHPLGAVLGDLLVRPASSTSPNGVDAHDRLLVGGVTHVRLLDHPAVTEQVVAWVQEPARG